jgi:hypothetical protein
MVFSSEKKSQPPVGDRDTNSVRNLAARRTSPRRNQRNGRAFMDRQRAMSAAASANEKFVMRSLGRRRACAMVGDGSPT